MSADNWTTCPRCQRRAEDNKAAQQSRVAEAYGKVPSNVWQQMVREAEAPIRLDSTLREDYGIGLLESGRFFVSYRCSCHSCDFQHEFKHEEQTSE